MEKLVMIIGAMIIVLEINQKAEWTSHKLQGKNNATFGNEAEDGWP